MNAQLTSLKKAETVVWNAITFNATQNSSVIVDNNPNIEVHNQVVDDQNSLQENSQDSIINNNQETGVDIDGSTNTELLAGGEVSAVSGSGDGVRQQSENSRKLAEYLGNVGAEQGTNTSNYRAGESGWLVRSSDVQTEQARLEESVLRAVSGISISGRDTAGRTISPEVAKNFEKTVFKDKEGTLLSLYHWTTAVFDRIKNGEVWAEGMNAQLTSLKKAETVVWNAITFNATQNSSSFIKQRSLKLRLL